MEQEPTIKSPALLGDEILSKNQNDIMTGRDESLQASKKLSRNVSEKIRRDRLNSLIQELAKEVPIIASCQKKLDKSSILRLTSAYLKFHIGMKKMKMSQKAWRPTNLADNLGQVLQEAVDGFLLVVSKKGIIILLSEAIGQLLGHNQFDLMGKDIASIIHPEDKRLFLAQFSPRAGSPSNSDNAGSSRSFYVRFLNINCRENSTFTMVHIKGHLQDISLLSRESNTGNNQDVWLTGCGRLLQTETMTNISLIDPDMSEWITQHALDGKILYTDPRSSQVTGLLPGEQFGSSVYIHIVPEDIDIVGRSHQKIMSAGEIPSTVFRLQTLDPNVVYIESRSCIARDSWTNQPKFIVSLNTKLSTDEGILKLEQQRLSSPAISAVEAEDLLSDVFKTATDLSNANPNAEDPSSSESPNSFAFTNQGDILQALNGAEYFLSTGNGSFNSSQNTCLDDNATETSSTQGPPVAHSDRDQYFNSMNCAPINIPQSAAVACNVSSTSVHSNAINFTTLDASVDLNCERSVPNNSISSIQDFQAFYPREESKQGVPNHSSSLHSYVTHSPRRGASLYTSKNMSPYSSSSSSYRSEELTVHSNTEVQGKRSFLAEILHQKVPSHSQNSGYDMSSAMYYSQKPFSSPYSHSARSVEERPSDHPLTLSSWSDSNVSVSSGSPQKSTSPPVSGFSNITRARKKINEEKVGSVVDAFQVFSDQLQRKHVEIDRNLIYQSSEIAKIDNILTRAAHHKNSQQYKKMEKRLTEIKANQNMILAELEKLKQEVTETNEKLPHSTNQHLEPMSPDSSASNSYPMSISHKSNSIDVQLMSSPPASTSRHQSCHSQSQEISKSNITPSVGSPVFSTISDKLDNENDSDQIIVQGQMNGIKNVLTEMSPPVQGVHPKQKQYSNTANNFYASTL